MLFKIMMYIQRVDRTFTKFEAISSKRLKGGFTQRNVEKFEDSSLKTINKQGVSCSTGPVFINNSIFALFFSLPCLGCNLSLKFAC